MSSIFSSPKPSPTQITVSAPEKSDTEKQLLQMQLDLLKSQQAQSPEQQALYNKSTEYYQQMINDNTLSPEEEADFEKEYNLQLQALNEQFGRETKEAGGSQMASLVARGMFDTTTGRNEMAKSQEDYANILAQQTVSMGGSKETAKYNMDLAKKQLSQSGYELTTGLNQNQMQTALQASMAMQNYYLNQGAMQANAALTNAMSTQAMEKAKYNQRMNMWGSVVGMGSGLLKAGA
jgi:hypothetical protein